MIQWHNPLPLKLIPTNDPESFRSMQTGTTGLPIGSHPGAFATRRKHHTHEGVDLYAPVGTEVFAVERGEVKEVRQFTGPELGHDWWLPTWAVWIEGENGTVVYGEILPSVTIGDIVEAGDVVGSVMRVISIDKGRPTSMLHLELRSNGNTDDIEWIDHDVKPDDLLDPTPFLLTAV